MADLEKTLREMNARTTNEARELISNGENPVFIRGIRTALEEFTTLYDPERYGVRSFAAAFLMFQHKLLVQFKALEAKNWETDEPSPSRATMHQAFTGFWEGLVDGCITDERQKITETFQADQNIESAISSLRKALSFWGEHSYLLSDLSTLEFRLGHVDAALTHSGRAAELDPSNQAAIENLDRMTAAVNRTPLPDQSL